MRAHREWAVAGMATAAMACVEPMEPEVVTRFAPDECTVLYPGPGVDDGLVGICHACDDGYEYVRVSPEACRRGHALHELDFRSDDPLCRILPGPGRSHEPVVDTAR